MPQQPDPLLGRADELAAAMRAVDALDRRTGGVVAVTGAAGIGKSRLLAELARTAAARGATVLEGRATEFEHVVPFSVFVDALDSYLRADPGGVVAQLAREDLEELTQLFPGLRPARREGDRTTSPDERVRAYFALRRLLGRLAAGRPLVLLLDDLHWADRASVEAISYLLRRPPDGPVLLLCGFRPAQADGALGAAFAAAERDGSLTALQPRPLTLEETGELAGVTGRARARLHELSGGNPFLVIELARAGATSVEGEGGDLPRSVADAIVRELTPLSAPARALAEGGAVVGDPFDLDLAVAAADLADDKAFDALDELARHDLVRRTDVPRRFAWRHPLVRRAISESVLPGRRLAAHQRCADLLAARGAPVVDRAVHVEYAARPGDAEAVGVLRRAAEEAAGRAPASAVGWLRAALRLLPSDAPDEDELELVAPLPALHLALGETAEAHAAALRALDLAPSGDTAQRAALAIRCATLDQLLGNHDAAHERLVRTLDSLPERLTREAADVMTALVLGSFYRREHAEGQEWGRRAVELATRLDDRPLLAGAHAALAMTSALAGSVAAAEEHRAQAAALVDRMSDAELAGRLDAAAALAGAELYLDRYPEAAAHADRGLRVGRASGTVSSAPTLVPTLGTATWVVGRITDSRRLLDEATEAARAARNDQVLAWLLFNLGFAELMAGDVGKALASTGESLDLALRLEDSMITTWAAAVAGAALAENGDPSGALDLLHERCGGPTLAGVPGGWRCHYLEVAVRCHLDLGDVAAAGATAEEARAVADAVGLPYARSMAARAVARVSVHRGEPAEAVELLRTALADSERAGARTDAALTRTHLGRALAAAGRTDEAVAELRTAAAALDAMGAVRYRDQAERELGRLGRRPHRRTPPGEGEAGLASLTRRELEVARLVADRRTNPEIAEALFLSVKTVETHLRNIFRKLGVATRADLARAVEADQAGAPAHFGSTLSSRQ